MIPRLASNKIFLQYLSRKQPSYENIDVQLDQEKGLRLSQIEQRQLERLRQKQKRGTKISQQMKQIFVEFKSALSPEEKIETLQKLKNSNFQIKIEESLNMTKKFSQFNYKTKYIACSNSTANDTCSSTQCCLQYTGGKGIQAITCAPDVGGVNLCKVWGGKEMTVQTSQSAQCTQDSFNNTCVNKCCQKIIDDGNSINPQYLCAPLSFCQGFREESFYAKQNIKLYAQSNGINLNNQNSYQKQLSDLQNKIMIGLLAILIALMIVYFFIMSKNLKVIKQLQQYQQAQNKSLPQTTKINQNSQTKNQFYEPFDVQLDSTKNLQDNE